MRSPTNLKTYSTPSGRGIEICVTPPNKFVVEHQDKLLPAWDASVSYLILVLQQSLVSGENSSVEVTQEKNRLRTKFLRFGCSLIFALQDRGYNSDLFDPRTGYALLADSELTLDDNAIIEASLGYPTISYRQCSLLIHPTWKHNIYPSTIATSAPREIIELSLRRSISDRNWVSKADKSSAM